MRGSPSMCPRHRHPRWPAVLAIAGLALLGSRRGAQSASTSVVAVLGDPAPGGGVFAGPGFAGWPAAAGNGWITFRGEVAGGGTTEAMVVAHMVAPVTRAEVARIGQPAPGGGTFKQFLGRPTVNANGDVAFLAQVTRSDTDDDPTSSSPAGIFLYRAGALTAVARSGQVTAAGKLDLLAVVDPDADSNQLPERAPALNDAGDVAFLSGIQDRPQANGAIFRAPLGGEPAALVRIGDAFDGGAFVDLGPPALNNAGRVVFHGKVATTDPNEDGGMIDGIFDAGMGPTSAGMVVRDGQLTSLHDLPLSDFEDPVAIDDYGDVVFMAGPLYDIADGVPDGPSPGILMCSAGIITVIAYPGRMLGPDQISSFQLGPAGGSVLAPPSLTPDGRVAYFASLAGGSREVIALWGGGKHQEVVHTGGFGTDATPAGGVYAGTESAAAIDATGSIAFLARVAGGVTSEAVVYQPVEGTGIPIVVGDAAPSAGFFAGDPFSIPLLNDAGDVVFRAFLARGSTSVGIFRARGGLLEALVRAGDPSPTADEAPFLNLLGQPSLNQAGAVAFAAQVPRDTNGDGVFDEQGVGIYVVDENGLRAVVVAGDPAPDPGTVFKSLSTNPSINDQGVVAFRGTTLLRDFQTNTRSTRQGIFLADGTGIHPLVWAGDPAPGGTHFFALRDPVLTNVPRVAFRAALGDTKTDTNGVFVADADGISRVVVEKDDLGDGVTLSHLSGDPIVTGDGGLALLGIRTRQIQPGLRKTLGPAILQRTSAGLDLVVAQDMPGPAGGTFRNLAGPSVNSLGHVAFRASFLPFTGGTGGIFLATAAGLEPYLSSGEATPSGGRFASFGAHSALNAHDDLAFTATISRGTSRSGIFLASRTHLEVRALDVRLGRRGTRDRIRVRLALQVGRLTDGLDPAHDPLTVSLADGRGTLWSATVSPGLLKRRAGALVAVPRAGSALARLLRVARLELGRRGTPRVSALSAPLDLTLGGQRPLQAPLSVTLQLGDDGATRALPCQVGRHGVHCHAL